GSHLYQSTHENGTWVGFWLLSGVVRNPASDRRQPRSFHVRRGIPLRRNGSCKRPRPRGQISGFPLVLFPLSLIASCGRLPIHSCACRSASESCHLLLGVFCRKRFVIFGDQFLHLLSVNLHHIVGFNFLGLHVALAVETARFLPFDVGVVAHLLV